MAAISWTVQPASARRRHALALIISIALIVVLPVQLLKDRRMPYAFSPEEVCRFNIVGKLKAKGLL
jgi:hypothetical protein